MKLILTYYFNSSMLILKEIKWLIVIINIFSSRIMIRISWKVYFIHWPRTCNYRIIIWQKNCFNDFLPYFWIYPTVGSQRLKNNFDKVGIGKSHTHLNFWLGEKHFCGNCSFFALLVGCKACPIFGFRIVAATLDVYIQLLVRFYVM